jgi:diguanylate cyclase (GGDEF)-like protein
MTSVESPEIAARIARRIVVEMAKPIDIDGQLVVLSVSVGVAIAESSVTTEQLLHEADSAMYEAKAAGKNRYRVFDSGRNERDIDTEGLVDVLGPSLLPSGRPF